jgi:hypothetical protein
MRKTASQIADSVLIKVAEEKSPWYSPYLRFGAAGAGGGALGGAIGGALQGSRELANLATVPGITPELARNAYPPAGFATRGALGGAAVGLGAGLTAAGLTKLVQYLRTPE